MSSHSLYVSDEFIAAAFQTIKLFCREMKQRGQQVNVKCADGVWREIDETFEGSRGNTKSEPPQQ